ncbi:MAG: alpha/beta hydrolase [Planctomycetaceae bacterium]|jgi:pimeloyl-ACP methyl ester carboxylesterase|nr:alpha/beta hydrolase [Planctomycetaceae bacterium]
MGQIIDKLVEKSVRISGDQSSDIAINLYDGGNGIPLLFIHGFPFDGLMWRRAAEILLRKSLDAGDNQGAFLNYRTIIPDLRGLGKSELLTRSPTKTGISIEQYADDLDAILTNLKIDSRVIVAGLSMGGYIAIQFAHRHNVRVAGLVLCNTKTTTDSPEGLQGRQDIIDKIYNSWDTAAGVLDSVADAMIPKFFAAKTYSEKPDIVDEIRAMIKSNNPHGVSAASWGMMKRCDSSEILASFDLPVLVIGGEEDKFTPPDSMKQLAKIAKHAEYVEITAAGHLPPIEQPKSFAIALNNFIKKINF